MLLIKIGGGEKINIDYISSDIKKLIDDGLKVIIVHGASATRDKIAKQLHIETRTITSPSGISSVYTDDAAIDVFLMAYAGLINKKIVANLQKYNVNAIGLSGIDGRLWEAKSKKSGYFVENGKTMFYKDNKTGRVDKINVDLLELLLDKGYVPVICPPAISFENDIVNTDNDFATAMMVQALKIKEMVVLFEAPGILRNLNDISSVIKKIKKSEIEKYMIYAQGRMKKKLLGTKKAFESGLLKMYCGDGRVRHPIINVLKGKGTTIL
jgi:acetylglutamate/LysW-gamma-L-alpha-aminoadipate kinase